jgi:oxygen-independent coproporphyrinogen III oxidase
LIAENKLSQQGLTCEIETLYVGGGTPSLLSAEQYHKIFNTFKQYFPFASTAEITLEANPGKKVAEMASSHQNYLDLGFNRLSIGLQSLDNQELKTLSRVHSAEEAIQFVHHASQQGWPDISVDLMYALPGQTVQSWHQTLDKLATLPVQHVSMYGLKVEEGTPLDLLSSLRHAQTRYNMPDDDLNVMLYEQGMSRLIQMGYLPYEFSNFAQPGHASRHNLNYWNNQPFLAFGPSAHGFFNGERYTNTANLATYCKNPLSGTRNPCSAKEQLENALIFGLRKTEGLHIPTLEQYYGINFWIRYGQKIAPFLETHLHWHPQSGQLRFRPEGIAQSNFVLVHFLED